MVGDIVLKRIIEKVEQEVCPAHKQSVKLTAKNGVIKVSGDCCPEFYGYISSRISEELTKEANVF